MIFDNDLRKIFHTKPEVLKYLTNHEKKPVCIENICDQIEIAEIKHPNLKLKGYSDIIKSGARLFAEVALDQKHQAMLSDLAKSKITKENTKIERAKECIEDIEKWSKEDKTKVFQSSKLKAIS